MVQLAIFGIIVFVSLLGATFKVLKEYERGVILRLGRFKGLRGPGLVLVIPFIEKIITVDTRIITMDVPSQDVITKDNVSVKVNAVVYFRVMDPERATLHVEDFYYATSQLAQTTLRSVCGEAELDGLLGNREEFNKRIQDILDTQTDPWGIKVVLVEVKHIDLPTEMQRAMAKEAEAERERRAKIIKSEGEFQASAKLAEAAEVMSANAITLQLRYLETLRDISIENSSTVVFPVPIEMLEVFNVLKQKGKKEE